MTMLVAAVAVEARKARSARVLWATGSLLVVGVAALAGVTVLAARSGDAELVAKLGPVAAGGGWSGWPPVWADRRPRTSAGWPGWSPSAC